jgi:hypothetical protein
MTELYKKKIFIYINALAHEEIVIFCTEGDLKKH